jgi:hypothetical protein
MHYLLVKPIYFETYSTLIESHLVSSFLIRIGDTIHVLRFYFLSSALFFYGSFSNVQLSR